MGPKKSAFSNTSTAKCTTKKQIITNTLEEISKEINYTPCIQEGIPGTHKRKRENENNKSIIEDVDNLDIKNTTNQASSTKGQIIRNILQKKRREMGSRKTTKDTKKRKGRRKSKAKARTKAELEVHESVDESEDLPLATRILNYDKDAQSLLMPEITSLNWSRFKKEVAEKEMYNQKIKKCLDKMHSYQTFDLHFSSLYFIRKAIVDSLLNRKWDNLVKLLVMLIKNYSDPVFTMFVRHMCEILKHYHPRIRGTDLEDQIELIIEKHEKMRNSRRYALNIA